MPTFLTCLAIETSCDDTAVAVLRGQFGQNGLFEAVCVLGHGVHSQIEIHRPFGGVVPEVAARDHLAKLHPLCSTVLDSAKCLISDINFIAVTAGPGLIGALMVGVTFAQGLSSRWNIPLIAINHVDAHLAPSLLLADFDPVRDLGISKPVSKRSFPILGLTVSGGHCILSALNSFSDRTILGHTLDDACGEAFDKVAKLLALPYPGGPMISNLAKSHEESFHLEKRKMEHDSVSDFWYPKFRSDISQKQGPFMFSYSGLKTQALEVVRERTKNYHSKISGENLSESDKNALAHAFQKAAIGQLFLRLNQAVLYFPGRFKEIAIAGGVAANEELRKRVIDLSLPVHFAPRALCSDNAVMIALHALETFGKKICGESVAVKVNKKNFNKMHCFSRYPYGG